MTTLDLIDQAREALAEVQRRQAFKDHDLARLVVRLNQILRFDEAIAADRSCTLTSKEWAGLLAAAHHVLRPDGDQ